MGWHAVRHTSDKLEDAYMTLQGSMTAGAAHESCMSDPCRTYTEMKVKLGSDLALPVRANQVISTMFKNSLPLFRWFLVIYTIHPYQA